MTTPSAHRRLRFACWMTIAALAMFVWSVLDPGVIPVMIAMSVGQVLGTLATMLFLWVVLSDLRRARVLDRERR
ncbi:MAG: hypothetical protein RIT81_00035 [Deltaproteobacteria bacterium]